MKASAPRLYAMAAPVPTVPSSGRLPRVLGRVLIVGMGGLGCPVSLALAQAGVRALTIVDADRIDVSNLHRQPWYRDADVGQPKVEVAAARLRAAFPELEVTALAQRVTAGNAAELLSAHDVTVDGTDSISTKFLLSDAAVLTGRSLVYGGVLRFEGQVLAIRPGGPCLRCLFETPPGEDDVPTCAQAGVLGSVAGVIGGLQALEVLSLLEGKPRADGVEWLRVFDAQRFAQRQVKVRRARECSACGAAAKVTLAEPRVPQC